MTTPNLKNFVEKTPKSTAAKTITPVLEQVDALIDNMPDGEALEFLEQLTAEIELRLSSVMDKIAIEEKPEDKPADSTGEY